MALTRFKGRTMDGGVSVEVDGPVSGALQILTLNLDVATGVTKNFKIDLPAGMRFRVTDASVRASVINGSPTIIVGLVTNGSSKLIASTAITTTTGALTVKSASQNVPAGNVIVAQVAGSVVGGVLTLAGHVSAPPTTVLVRNASHF